MMQGRKSGFILLESMVTCVLVMMLWYGIMQCAVNLCMRESRVQHTMRALCVAASTLDKLKHGLYALKSQSIADDIYSIIIECADSAVSNALVGTSVTVLRDDVELVCIKSLLIKR